MKRSLGTVKRWKRQGMPTRLHDGQREVELETLLQWWRESIMNSPTNRARFPDHVPTRHAPARKADEFAGDDQPAAMTWAELAEALRLRVGGPEYRALQRALKDQTPACDGLTIFTDRHGAEHSDDERAFMAAICEQCPVLELCRAFAEVARPDGYWAGRRWKTMAAAPPESRANAS